MCDVKDASISGVVVAVAAGAKGRASGRAPKSARTAVDEGAGDAGAAPPTTVTAPSGTKRPRTGTSESSANGTSGQKRGRAMVSAAQASR